MSNSLRDGVRLLLALLFMAVFLGTGEMAIAQVSLPGVKSSSTATTENEALNKFLDEARQSGARVIVIDPQEEGGTNVGDESMPMAMALTGSTLLKARAEFLAMMQRVLGDAPDLPAEMAAMDERRDLRWVLVAVATAVGGIICGTFVFRISTQWGRKHFAAFYRPEDKRRSSKLAYLLGRAGWMLISVAIGFGTAVVVAVIFDTGHQPTRDLIFVIISTFASYRVMRSVFFWNFFLPDTPSHRLINLSDKAATRMFRDWSVALAFVAVVIGLCRWVLDLGLGRDFTTLFQIAGLLVSVLVLMGFAISHRHEVAGIILGTGAPEAKPAWLKLLAYASLPIALAYLVLAWFMSSVRLVLGLPGGYILLAAPFIVFVIAVFVYALSLLILEKLYELRAIAFRRNQIHRAATERRAQRRLRQAREISAEMNEEDRDLLEEGEMMRVHIRDKPAFKVRKYVPVFKPFFEQAIQAIILVVALGALARLWSVDFGGQSRQVIEATLNVVLVLLIAYAGYRSVNEYIDLKIAEEGGTPEGVSPPPGETDSEGGVGQSRLATLLPIFRNFLTGFILLVVGTTTLSYLGVDVAPLFAGAGVVGIAIGFGAQTLIRDVFSGAFFLIDDAFRKGEYVEIDQVRGVVEKISIRSFQLRHHLGAVHTIPFGEIHRLTNYSRDWVMMKLPLRVTYDTDVEKVRKLVKKLGEQLLDDPAVGSLFLQPLKSQGVYKMEDSAMIIRVKYMTKPGDQFITRKVVYSAIRELFYREGIHFAHREVTVRLADGKQVSDLDEEQKKAVVGSVRSVIDEEIRPPDEKAAAADR